MNLFEGLKEGDLEGLVLPLISVDEFESKLDDDSIVIAFYVQDKDPAGDLNRFIQKGAVSLLDTDVSPAPNEEGYFMVFVELLRDADMPAKTMEILATLHGLTGIKEWRCQVYDVEETQEVSLEVLSGVRLVSLEEAEVGVVREFFRASDLEDLILEGRDLELRGTRFSVKAELVDFGGFEDVRENNAVMSQGLRLDEAAQSNVSRLQALLGDLWLIEHLNDHVLLSSLLSDRVALLRL